MTRLVGACTNIFRRHSEPLCSVALSQDSTYGNTNSVVAHGSPPHKVSHEYGPVLNSSI